MNENNINLTSINLGDCEYNLKNYYKISNESNLYILKIDIKQKGKNYPLIEYEVFYPLYGENNEILDLNLCNDTNIELSIPIIINDTIDKYNPKSNYYNDICTKATSKYNTDITLYDRRIEFINNDMSLCEENCELISYDNIYRKAKCSCKVKTSLSLDNIELDNKNILKNFIDIKKITNIEIVKCYKIVFNINNIKSNYGSFIILFIFILYFISIIIFYCKSLKKLIKKTIEIINSRNNKGNQITVNNYIYSSNKGIHKKRLRKRNIKNKKIENTSTKKKIILKKKKNKRKNLDKKQEKHNNKLEYTDAELNSLSYKDALNKDKRTYIQYYLSLLKQKQLILFSFYPNKDYNVQIIKSFLFFFYYSSDLAINALFFTDDTMHKIYTDSGKFNFMYQLPQIIYSYLISSGINFIIEYLSLSDEVIISIKTENSVGENKKKKMIKNIKIRFCCFFIITFILLLIFGYYISCFCCIYENTQIHLIKDSLLSLLISSIIPFFKSLIPGIFRIPALRNKKGNNSCLYKISQIIEFF